MRFTVTLDPDVDTGLRKLMSKENLKFKDAVNLTLGRGLRVLDAAKKADQPKTTKRNGR